MITDTPNYYTPERCEQIFNSVKNSRWRIWKIVAEDGFVHQNKFQISSPERLFKFIHQYGNPQALYTSISEFLNPHKVHGFFSNRKMTTPNGYVFPRAGYIYADSILLDSYFFVDIDDENDISLVQEDGRKIIEYMEKKIEFNLKNIRFSGTKGIHLEFERSQRMEIINPIDRIKVYKAQNERIAKELAALGLKTMDKHHINVMTDVFRVCAAPYSIKAKSGGIVTPIDLTDFMEKNIQDIIPLTSEAKANEKVAAPQDSVLQPSNIRDRGRAGLSTYPHHFGVVANFVPGLKNNYVPFIKLHKSRHVDFDDIANDLGDLLIFAEQNHYWLIGYKLFQKEKLLKVMRRLKASNYAEFQKRYAKFRFTNILDKEKGGQVSPAPRLIHKLKSKKEYTYSLAHKNFFREFDEQEKLYGKPELKTYEAIQRP